MDHQIRQGLRVNADTFYEHTGNDFRSTRPQRAGDRRAAGCRPSAACCSSQSIGRSTRGGVNVDVVFSPRPGDSSATSATATRARAMTRDDALTPPPPGTFETRVGRRRAAMCRTASPGTLACRSPGGASPTSLNGRLQSGTPYNVTTGIDDNGDAIFNDRPSGTPRNSLRGAVIDADRPPYLVDRAVAAAEQRRHAQRGPGGGPLRAVLAPRRGGPASVIRAGASRCTCSCRISSTASTTARTSAS